MSATALAVASLPAIALIGASGSKAFKAWYNDEQRQQAAAELMFLRQQKMGRNPGDFVGEPSEQALARAYGWTISTLRMVTMWLRQVAGGKNPNYWPSTSDIVADIMRKTGGALNMRAVQAFVMETRDVLLRTDQPGTLDYLWYTGQGTLNSTKAKVALAAAIAGGAILAWRGKKRS